MSLGWVALVWITYILTEGDHRLYHVEDWVKLGHSKDHRPDLPQLKIAMSTLDPLGLPLTITTVAGNKADDPLYLPEIGKIRQIAQTVGLTYVGDCKMAAFGTRAQIVAYQDFYLCPLSAKQMPEAELDRLLEPVFNQKLKPVEIRLPDADGQIDETEDPVAIGFEQTVEQSGQDQNGNDVTRIPRIDLVKNQG